MSETEATVADWQHRLDREFRSGVLASWDDRSSRTTYLLPRVYVVAVHGRYPVIWASAFAGSDKTLGPWQVTSYTIDALSPRIARVTFEGIDKDMRWSAGLDDKAKAEMLPERSKGIQQFPDGGMEVIHVEGTDLP